MRKLLLAIGVVTVCMLAAPRAEACVFGQVCLNCAIAYGGGDCYVCIYDPGTSGGCDCDQWGFGDGSCDQCITYGECQPLMTSANAPLLRLAQQRHQARGRRGGTRGGRLPTSAL